MSLRPWSITIALGAFAAGLGLWRPTPGSLLINETPSMPRGVYVRTHRTPQVGAIVALSLPPGAQAYFAGRTRRADPLLLKRVVATPGEAVCRNGRQLIWTRGTVVALDRDRRGRSLPAWQGCVRLGPGELLVLGDGAASFDSRYLGPVRGDRIVGVYRPLVIW